MAFTLYGWWHWWRGVRAEGEVRVVPLSARGWIAGLVAGAIGAFALGWLMVRIGAALPHLDAALTSYSLVASWWQARKHTANWWLWIVIDGVYIGEYAYKDLWLTAVLSAGLVVLAVLGLRDWRRRGGGYLYSRLNDIVKWFAGHVAAQFVSSSAQRAWRKLRRRTGHMRRDQQIRAAPQGMSLR